MSERKLYRPSDLRAFLKEKGLYAKKGLSQNFLIDGNIIQKIIRSAQIQQDDLVIEIGPGPGALTQALLAQGAQVTAIEKDPLFAQELLQLQTPDHRLRVVCEDVLRCQLPTLYPNRRVKVVANLPYHITTPILIQLLPLYSSASSLTLMVQKEFAERMTAHPKTSEYSSFTVFLNFYSDTPHSFVVSPHCFYPAPKVFSSVVHCTLHPPPPDIDTQSFFNLTRTAFGKRRKTLCSSLRSLYPSALVEQALEIMGLPKTTRPEELSLDQFLVLYQNLPVIPID